MLRKHWHIRPPAPPDLLAQYRTLSPILAQILYNRDLRDPQRAGDFLQATHQPASPFAFKDMSRAVARIRQGIKNGELMTVYGDFDADGVTSTALLMQTLTSLGARVKPYIPDRVEEGYGLNSEALRKLARGGCKLVITVDCGIRAVEEIADGNAFGLDIIVTDHHSIGPEIPEAFAVINPKQEDCDYPEDMLAGVGVAFRLAEALLTAANGNRDRRLPELKLEDLLDLVAIGTVADIAPLNRLENRALVTYGLQQLNDPQRPGLQALFDVAGIKPGAVGATTIGFSLGPRINAAGRLGTAMIAYHLLTTDDPVQADELAHKLQDLNEQRQILTRSAQDKIRHQLEQVETDDLPLIFAGDRSFSPGIVGLVAGRLTEEYFRPAIILEQGTTESRASCRSIPQFDITHALDQCADLLVRHGGHAQAAGFTIRNENIPALEERLTGIARDVLDGQELAPTIDVDIEVDPAQMTMQLAEELLCLEPTGHLNTAPIFASQGMIVQECRTVGKTGDHLKLRLYRPGTPPVSGIGFGLGAWNKKMPPTIDVAYHLEINEYNGRRSVQMNVQDIKPAGA